MTTLLEKIHEEIDKAPEEVLKQILIILEKNKLETAANRTLKLPRLHLKGVLDNFKRDDCYE